MSRKYKLIIIILVSVILTYFIYFYNKDKKITIMAMGDSVASGETSYNIDGISYNDYLKEYFKSKHLLKKYNDSYAFKNNKLEELLEDIKNNVIDKKNNLNIQQIIHKSDIITISIGEEELIKLQITKDLSKEVLDEYIYNYDELIKVLKDITDAKIVIIGLYENKYLDKSNVIIVNSNLSNIAIKYNIVFININDLMLNKEYYLDSNSYYFNYKAHEIISNMIIHSL